MVSRNTAVIILLSLSVLFNGCAGEKKTAPDSIQEETVDVSNENKKTFMDGPSRSPRFK